MKTETETGVWKHVDLQTDTDTKKRTQVGTMLSHPYSHCKVGAMTSIYSVESLEGGGRKGEGGITPMLKVPCI